MSDYRFIIVDDHPLFRGALSQALRDAFDKAEVLEAGSLDELIERLAAAGETDLILLDLTMPGVHGVSGLL
jgi:DNA-binding NarL/FixJ family response regulator